MPKWLVPVGRSFFAVGLGSIGLMHFFFMNFPWVIIPQFPAWIPLRLLWVLIVGMALVVAGVCILFNLRGRKVAAWTGVALLVLVVIAHLPNQLTSQYRAVLGAWTNPFKELTLAGGAWIAAMTFGEASGLPEWLERALPLGRCFFATMLIVFGVDHFLYTKFVATLVPTWVVGGQIFWAYFAGVALISGGIGILVKRVAPLAALMVGVMIFLWLLMLHIPRAIVDPYTNVGNEWASVFEALAFSGIAFMLAGIRR